MPFDAADYGIYPDGTDYSTKMQALVDYISSTKGSGTIRLRATVNSSNAYVMKWIHKTGVMVESSYRGGTFVGNGTAEPGTTIQIPSGGGLIVTDTTETNGGGCRGIRFKGLGAGTTAQGLVMGQTYQCRNFVLEDCEFENFSH